MTFEVGYRIALEIHEIKQSLANHQEYIRIILERLEKLENKQNGTTSTTDTSRR